MKKLMKVIDTVEEKFMVYSFLFTVALVFIQVCMRAFVNDSLPWSEELARYLFIWQCWVGVSFAQRSEKHIRIEILPSKLSEKGRARLDVLQMVITLMIVVFLIVYGVIMVQFLIGAGTRSSALQMPMYLVYIAMPLSCAVYGIRLIGKLVNMAKGKEEVV